LATGSTYDPGNLYSTTYYVVVATDAVCGNVTSNLTTINVHQPFNEPLVGSAQTICYNLAPALLTVTHNTDGNSFNYIWQMTQTPLNPGSWANVGTNPNSYQPGALTATTSFRVIAFDAGVPNCGSITSNEIVITVKPQATPGSISADQTICYGSAPAPFGSVSAGTGTGSITYRWEYSTNGTSWTSTGTTTDTYTPGTLTLTTLYRRIAIASDINGVCESVPTTAITVTVQSVISAGTIGSDQLIVSGGTAAAITSSALGTGSGTITYTWESSVNAGITWNPVSGETGTGIAPGILTQSTWYHRITSSTLSSSICTATSSPVKITVSIQLNVKVKIEGAVNVSGTMDTKINTIIPLAQPYNTAPWNYTGTETLSTIPADMVDWVLVELRQATGPSLATSGTIIAKQAGLLKSSGSIVDVSGSILRFDNYGVSGVNNLYVVIRHRNHLAIMSNTGAGLNAGVYSYDFTSSLSQAYGGGNGYKAVSTTFAMVSGDIDQDGSIAVSDYNSWAAGFGLTNSYFRFDLDMDKQVAVSDYNKWAANFGLSINSGLKSANIKSKYYSTVPK
jgi:hypothetical protein